MIAHMPKPFVQPSSHKRGNPNWGTPLPFLPATATEFELLVKKLGLAQQAYVGSRQLRDWCKQNKNRCYIPEWLLAEWEIEPDPTSTI